MIENENAKRLIELIDRSNFIKKGKPNISRISSASVKQIVDFCEHFSEACTITTQQHEKSIHIHSASFSLSGHRTPCMSVKCRLLRIQSLIHFAAFYSDKVYVHNFLDDYVHHAGQLQQDPDECRNTFIDDLTIINKIRPLIEDGCLQPVTLAHMCPSCIEKHVLKSNTPAKLIKTRESLNDRFLKEVEYSLRLKKGYYSLIGIGSEELLPHGWLSFVYAPSGVEEVLQKELATLMSRLKEGEEIKLTKAQVKKIHGHIKFAGPIIQSTTFELVSSYFLGSSCLLDSDLELSILKGLSTDPVLQRRSSLMHNYLTCLLPVLEGVSPVDLLSLRKKEQESFLLFRGALTKAIEEYKGGSTLNERDAQIIYSDILEPKITALTATLKKQRRLFTKDVGRRIVGWVGAMSLGFYTGLSMSDILVGASVFGITKALASSISSLMAKSDAEESIRSDEMYFLWKVKKGKIA